MFQDFASGSMVGYFIMVVGTSILAFLSKYFSNAIPFIIGNIATTIISFYFLSKLEVTLGVGWDEGYYKPLSPHQLLLLVSILNLVPQLLVMMLANRIKRAGVD